MRDQRRHADLPGGDQVEVLPQVAARRPAYERGRIIETPLLVVRVEETGPPGTAHAEHELLFEEELAWEIQAHQPRNNDAAALARDLGGGLDGLVAGGCGEDQDGVGSLAPGEGAHGGQQLRARRRRADVGAELDRAV